MSAKISIYCGLRNFSWVSFTSTLHIFYDVSTANFHNFSYIFMEFFYFPQAISISLFPLTHIRIFFYTLPALCFFGRFSHILLPFVICALPGESIAQTTFNSQIGLPCSSPPTCPHTEDFRSQRGPVVRCTFALMLAKTHRKWRGMVVHPAAALFGLVIIIIIVCVIINVVLCISNCHDLTEMLLAWSWLGCYAPRWCCLVAKMDGRHTGLAHSHSRSNGVHFLR